MTAADLTSIRNFLLDKKLPIDILVEVYDHFTTQISELQKEEGLEFDKAFEKVKQSWQGELQPSWKGEWDLVDRSELLRKINTANLRAFLGKALYIASVIVLALMLFSFLFSFHVYKYIFVIATGLILLLPFYVYFKNFKDFSLNKKYKKYVLVSFQEYTLLSLSCLYFYFKFFTEAGTIAKMFSGTAVDANLKSTIFGIVITYAVLVISLVSYYSQRKFLHTIEKVKPFLKHLNV
ncbi:hypothetical protein [Chryseobacterium sp.]|uniref:hypothetical protein n=1 Tax=Chryseobacterium sp. TaxID=1871047 RepID=UPI0012A97266|nr:hypothetical protein [Chryseobacterium sp.]QFG54108.1 hypothetical protein F7R58_11315 [Chryseobacterium sp.]